MSEYIEEMIGYKIFNDDLTCRGFKFKEQGINILGNDDPLELCKNGFHFCVHPSGVWSYYDNGRVFKIKAYDVKYEYQPGSDLKCVCRKIELLEEVKIDGDRNTGDGNTGYGNTGNRNTGYGNVGNNHSGYFNCVEKIFVFDKLVASIDCLDILPINELSSALTSDDPFDATPYLSIPNATADKIKKLHLMHIKGRKKIKGNNE